MAINYESQEWVNDSTGATPINDDALNHMEGGISDACAGVDELSSKLLTYLVESDGDTAGQDVNGNDIVEPCTIYDKEKGVIYFAPGGGEPRTIPFATPGGLADVAEYPYQLEAGLYPGRDLASSFADEVSEYGDVWEWLQARTQAGDFSGIRIGDYIDITLTDEVPFRALVAAIDPYYGCGDDGHVRGHHIVMMASAPVTVTGSYAVNDGHIKWNSTATNQGTASEKHPYLASQLHKWETEVFYNLLPQAVRDRIMVHRALLEERYSSSGGLTESGGWSWADLGTVWSPSEMEVYGCTVWGTKGWSVGYDCQFPIFKKTKDRINGSRVYWWLRVVHGGSSSHVCYVRSYGHAGNPSASNDWIRPRPCFLIG